MNKTDSLTLSYLAKSMDKELFEKSRKKANLVYVQKLVTRNGKQHLQGFWVSPEEAKEYKRSGSDMKSTKELHTKEGKYLPERHALHRQIVDKIIEQCGKPEPGQKPVAILMGGGSASGKSTMRESKIDPLLKEQGIKVGTVDADEIKKEIPEFRSLIETHPDDGARLVHDESSDITKLAMDEIIKQKRHFVYDGTAKNPEKYKKLIKQLKEAGYEVRLYGADVPLDEAKRRSDARAKKTGRKVPHDIIESSHKGFPKTFVAIKDMVDRYEIYDTQIKGNTRLIISNDDVNPELYVNFLKKGNVKNMI